MKQITIHSDGFGGQGTALVTEDGTLLDNVIEARISMQAGRMTEVELTMHHVGLNVTGTVTEVGFQCGLCGETRTHICETGHPGGLAPADQPTPEQVRDAVFAATQVSYTPCEEQYIMNDPHEIWTCHLNVHLPHVHHIDAVRMKGWEHSVNSGLVKYSYSRQ